MVTGMSSVLVGRGLLVRVGQQDWWEKVGHMINNNRSDNSL